MNRAASFVVVVGRLVDRRRPAKRRPVVCRDPSIAGIFTFRMCLKPRKYAHLAAQRCCRVMNLFRLVDGSIEDVRDYERDKQLRKPSVIECVKERVREREREID